MKIAIALHILAAGAACLMGGQSLAQEGPVYDVILRNGTVLDGTGLEPRRADVGIVGDRIIFVGDLSRARGRSEEDLSGLYVSPGFVSVHDHSTADSYTRPAGLLTQGVTTAIANSDGLGPTDIARQLTVPGGLGLNYGAYVGFNSVWQDVMGLADRRPAAKDVAAMQAIVRKAMADGAFGISGGLDYKPGFWATTAEAVAVIEAARQWRTNFPNHERLYAGNGFSSMRGMAETIEIGERSGVMPVITHMKLQGKASGHADAAFAMIAAAERRGHPVGVDAYPYNFGSTSLEQLLIPNWAQEGGKDAMLKRFGDTALRPRIAAETLGNMNLRWNGASGVYLPELKKRLPQVMEEMGGVAAGEAVMRLLERGVENVVLSYGTEADMKAILSDGRTAVSCDCGARSETFIHPRNWGNYPRFLGRYVRDEKLVSWSEGIRKMTALPATMIGLAERGYLLPGMIADVTVFDPRTVMDRATLEQPLLPSTGIRSVLVNGRYALRAGAMLQEPVGMRLVRSRHEPSRPMHFDVPRRLDVEGRIGDTPVRIALHVEQPASAAAPRGTVEIKGAGSPVRIVPSILQTAPGWASVTGVAEWKDGRREAVTIYAEERATSGEPSITVTVNGVTVASGRIRGGELRVRDGAAS